ncbi:hypothetical protein HPB51_006323 [Rhipicephalus microplus]|uniref:Uncharacterized protein n=1 Tax=Rhipicephalus microplus TaxID=6941 RepID=A0A9J6EMU9_RHIMP|nr:hypothetical protein HPB51_006323 [Rhipicephalus microplus]
MSGERAKPLLKPFRGGLPTYTSVAAGDVNNPSRLTCDVISEERYHVLTTINQAVVARLSRSRQPLSSLCKKVVGTSKMYVHHARKRKCPYPCDTLGEASFPSHILERCIFLQGPHFDGSGGLALSPEALSSDDNLARDPSATAAPTPSPMTRQLTRTTGQKLLVVAPVPSDALVEASTTAELLRKRVGVVSGGERDAKRGPELHDSRSRRWTVADDGRTSFHKIDSVDDWSFPDARIHKLATRQIKRGTLRTSEVARTSQTEPNEHEIPTRLLARRLASRPKISAGSECVSPVRRLSFSFARLPLLPFAQRETRHSLLSSFSHSLFSSLFFNDFPPHPRTRGSTSSAMKESEETSSTVRCRHLASVGQRETEHVFKSSSWLGWVAQGS